MAHQHLHESYVPVDGAELFCRQVGQGQPIVVVHGDDLDSLRRHLQMESMAILGTRGAGTWRCSTRCATRTGWRT